MASPRSLPELFGVQATLSPDRAAIRLADEIITYADLQTRARAIANGILSYVQEGSRVGILLDEPRWFPEAALGVLCAGCAYVPLDPGYPLDRLQFMTADAGLDLIVSDRDSSGQFPARYGVSTLAMLSATPSRERAHQIHPDDPAYIIYTSGSTGRPKGVVVTHHNVLSLLNASQSVFDFSYSDVWSLYHSYSFDFSVWELWGAFSTGGSVVPVSRDVRMSPTLFVQLLGRTGVTVLNVVPSVFKYIVDAYYDAGCPRLELRYIIFGGEMFDRAAAARWLATSSKRPRLVNMYGITETTVHVTAREIDDEELRRSGPTNIGVPLSHLDVMLVDDDLNEVPPMTVGEILVSGDGVASGYYGLPQLTNERFVERNVDGVARRHYRSGDLGRLREDGTYEYLGRADDQVKVLGFRIELGEIEAIMREVPAVCDAAVATTPGPRDDPVLVAIYVADRDEDEALRRLFRERLPRHMVPNRIARVAAIPLAPSGKRDRQAIALLTQTRASSHSVGH